jgi:hypothetical protein
MDARDAPAFLTRWNINSMESAVHTRPSAATDARAVAPGMRPGSDSMAGSSSNELAIERLTAMGPIESAAWRCLWMMSAPIA